MNRKLAEILLHYREIKMEKKHWNRLFHEINSLINPVAPIIDLRIMMGVCESLGVTFDELAGTGRHRILTDARAIYSYLCYNHTQMTLARIGKGINRDHSTVIYYLRSVIPLSEVQKKLEQINII